MLVNFITDVHTSTKRDYFARMTPQKHEDMAVARKFGEDFFDGDRRFGYGGYYKDNRWKPVAKKIADYYKLTSSSSVLDIGCGKGFLAYEIQELVGCSVTGCDISEYALDNCWVNCFKHDAGKDRLFGYYDLIISINTLHNLSMQGLKHALWQIGDRSADSFICVESYRNEKELTNLQAWALTCEQFHRPEDWEFLFGEFGHTGDWEFIYFE